MKTIKKSGYWFKGVSEVGKLEVPDAIVEKWGEPALDFDAAQAVF